MWGSHSHQTYYNTYLSHGHAIYIVLKLVSLYQKITSNPVQEEDFFLEESKLR